MPDAGLKLGKVPAAPRHLGTIGKRKWKEVSNYLLKMGILESRYLDALQVYCEAWDRKDAAEQVIKAEGLYVAHARGGGKTRHPAALELREALDVIRRMQIECGFTPAASASIKTPRGPDRRGAVSSRERYSERGTRAS